MTGLATLFCTDGSSRLPRKVFRQIGTSVQCRQETCVSPTRPVRLILAAVIAAAGSAVLIAPTAANASSASLVAYPEFLSFGNQLVNTTGPQVSVNITNEGTAAATISGITVTGRFTRAENCGATLAAGATCQVTTSFQPNAVGPTTGAITVSSNATNPTLVVNLSGTGVNPTPPTLNGAPPSITFPDTTVGAGVTRQLYIGNSGSNAATISSIVASGAGFTLGSGSCGTSLPGGSNCFMNVIFAPTTAGAKTGSVTVTSNATNPVLTFPLTGLGVAAGATNLALGKPAAGSSVAGHGPGKAVDSDPSSYWESTNHAFPQSITVDLGANASLSSVVLRVPAAWGSRTQTLSIAGSTGSGFTTIVGSAGYLFGTGAGNVVAIPLPGGTTARQVRITFTGNTGWPAGQLSDLQIIGVFA
jgi:hypothetical protein